MAESAQEFIAQTDEELRRYPETSRTGSGGRTSHGRYEAWTLFPQSNVLNKVFLFSRIRWEEQGIEYRWGYYIVDKNGKWNWARLHPDIPHADFKLLIEQACKEGTILKEDWPVATP